MIRFVDYFLNFGVVGLFIDFLTSGLSFVKIVGGLFYGAREVFLVLFLFAG